MRPNPCFPVLSIIHTDLKPENVLLDNPPRPPPESEQPPPLQNKKSGAVPQGLATTIEDLNIALSLADEHGLSAEEKRKLKKKVGHFALISLCSLNGAIVCYAVLT